MGSASRRWTMRLAFTGILCILAGSVWALGAGTVIVADGDGQISSAELTNYTRHSPLHRLPAGLFFGIPTFDGVIRIECRNGNLGEFGYVTRGAHVWEQVDCR